MPLAFEGNCEGIDEPVDSGVVVSVEEMKRLFPLAAVLQKGAGVLVDFVQYHSYCLAFGVLGWGVKKQSVVEVLDLRLSVERLSVEKYGINVEGAWQIDFGSCHCLSSSEVDSFECPPVLVHPLHVFVSQINQVLFQSHYHIHVWDCAFHQTDYFGLH